MSDSRITVESVNPFFEAGRKAFLEGKSIADCPYKFAFVGVDQKTFDAQYRKKLDAWTRGWVAAKELQK